jgi:cellulose synthase/poly-beta-1,6-N-acetylglucosamine synthase-like glycosyltransferase
MSSDLAGSFSVTVPADRDEAALEATLAGLVTGEELPSEVLVIVSADDPGTRAAAERVVARHRELAEVVVEPELFGLMTGEGAGWDEWDAPGTFSVTVPAQRDEAMLEETLSRLMTADEPPSEISLVVGTGDRETREVAERVARRHPKLVNVVVEAPLFGLMTGGRAGARASPAIALPQALPGAARAAAEAARKAAERAAARASPAIALPQALPGAARAVAEAARKAAERAAARASPAIALPQALPGAARDLAGAARNAAEQAAARLSSRLVVRVLAILAVAGLAVVALNTRSPLYLLYIGVSFVLAAIAWTTLVWMVSAWRTPGSLLDSGLPRAGLAPAHSFSLIVPARHEEVVLEPTLTRLVASDHPAFEVLVVVGTDDPGTREVAERVARRHPDRLRVVFDDSWPKSKPKALNAALPYCSGQVTGVFDAEDDVHPALLERVDECFQKTSADVVQAGVQLMNFRSSWLTVRNVLEYYFWFRSRLHFHARQGFIPLGGNTVFIRTDLLKSVSGWDDDSLAEDCELGVRLSALGARTTVFYEPDLVTREECPPTLGAFARQRTRWNQGYLQTLRKGYWRRLPLRQRALGLYTLAMPYLMAVVWLTIPVAIATAVLVKAPVPITLVSFLPVVPMVSMLAVEVAGLNDFCRVYGERASLRDYLRLVVGVLVYQAVLAFAAARAVIRELRGNRGWEKTAHQGLHLSHEAGQREPSPASPRVASPQAFRPLRATDSGGVLEPCADTSLLVQEPPSPAGNGHANGAGNGHENGSAVRRGNGSGNGRDNGSGNGHSNGSFHRPTPTAADGAVSLPLGRGAGGADVAHTGLRELPRLLRNAAASRADLLLLLALLAAIGFVQGTNMLHWPNTQFDEGTYVGNAWAVQHGALAPYTYSYGHPPLSWLLIALWTWVHGFFGDGSYTLDSGRQFMFLITMVSCALVYSLARRVEIGRAFAALAVLVFALSPVALYYHRAVLLDNIAIAWVLAAFVLALSPRHRLWAIAGSGACFAAGVLSKETTLVLLPALILAALRNADRRTRRYCLTLFGSLFLLIVLAYPLYATLKGELLPGEGHVSLLGYTFVQLFSREATGSLFDPTSQTHAIVNYWLGLDPWLLGGALLLLPIALARRSTRAVALAYLIQVVMILRPGYLPNMYVLGLLPFAALIVAGGSEALWVKARAMRFAAIRWPMRAAVAALAVVMALVVAPRWADRDHQATTVKLDGSRRAAERWMVENIGHDERAIVGDEFYIYLVEHGFDHRPVQGGFFSRTVVVYWPLDYDPAVKRRFPGGWRDFDYIVSTEAVRSTLDRTPTTREALEHSRVLAQFGRGDQRIEVRAIDRPQRSG